MALLLLPRFRRSSADDVNGGEEGPRLLTLDAAARALSISRRALDRLVANDEIATVHLAPRTIRIEVEEIEHYLRKHRRDGRGRPRDDD